MIVSSETGKLMIKAIEMKNITVTGFTSGRMSEITTIAPFLAFFIRYKVIMLMIMFIVFSEPTIIR